MDDPVVECAECRCASRLSEWSRLERHDGQPVTVHGCPNPRCRPGLRFETIVCTAHRRECQRVEDALRLTVKHVIDVRRTHPSSFPPEPVFAGVQPTLWPYYL